MPNFLRRHAEAGTFGSRAARALYCGGLCIPDLQERLDMTEPWPNTLERRIEHKQMRGGASRQWMQVHSRSCFCPASAKVTQLPLNFIIIMIFHVSSDECSRSSSAPLYRRVGQERWHTGLPVT